MNKCIDSLERAKSIVDLVYDKGWMTNPDVQSLAAACVLVGAAIERLKTMPEKRSLEYPTPEPKRIRRAHDIADDVMTELIFAGEFKNDKTWVRSIIVCEGAQDAKDFITKVVECVKRSEK